MHFSLRINAGQFTLARPRPISCLVPSPNPLQGPTLTTLKPFPFRRLSSDAVLADSRGNGADCGTCFTVLTRNFDEAVFAEITNVVLRLIHANLGPSRVATRKISVFFDRSSGQNVFLHVVQGITLEGIWSHNLIQMPSTAEGQNPERLVVTTKFLCFFDNCVDSRFYA
jgi:hypothetical protein